MTTSTGDSLTTLLKQFEKTCGTEGESNEFLSVKFESLSWEDVLI
jgi:hypothetical protein